MKSLTSLILILFLLTGCTTLGSERYQKNIESAYRVPESGFGKAYFYSLGIPLHTVWLAVTGVLGVPVGAVHDVYALLWALTNPFAPKDEGPFWVWWKHPALLFNPPPPELK